MKDYKDHATMELPGFDAPELNMQETKKVQSQAKRLRLQKQEQLDLLADFGPTDITGLPAWIQDENTDLTGLPVWR